MTLIAEDGTGLEGAESYLSVAEFEAYCVKRGYSLGAATSDEKEQKLRLATEFVDTNWRFKGSRSTATQALEFPRTGLIDWSGHSVVGIPARLKNATAELAFRALSEALYQDLDRGGMIKTETVGPISTTYMDGAPAQKQFTAAANALKPYIRSEKDTGPPQFGGATTGYFQLGDQDNPEAGAGSSDPTS